MAVCATQRVLTRHGPQPVKHLSKHGNIELWNGESFEYTTITPTKTPVILLEITLSDGTHIRCTSDRIFHIPSFSKGSFRKPVAAGKLHRGIRLAREHIPVLDTDKVLPYAYEQGAYSVSGREGEGFKSIKCNTPSIAAKLGAEIDDETDITEIIEYPKSHVPTCSSLESKKLWLSGLFDAMNIRMISGVSKTIVFRDQEFMKEVRLLLLTCGMRCSIHYKSNDVANLFFSIEENDKLCSFLKGDPMVNLDDNGKDNNGKHTRFRLLSAVRKSNPLIERAKKAQNPVVVKSIRKLEKPKEAYFVPGASVL